MTTKIVSAKIGPYPIPKVHAFFDDGTNEVLFEYYSDEISFAEKELIGLSKEQVFQLWKKKDLAYLRS